MGSFASLRSRNSFPVMLRIGIARGSQRGTRGRVRSAARGRRGSRGFAAGSVSDRRNTAVHL